MAKLDKAQAAIAELDSEAKALLTSLQLKEYEVPGKGTHYLKPTRGRGSNEINAKKFKELVSDKEFWATITVPVGKAKELLGEKTVEQISTYTPGKEGEPAYSFKPVA